MEPAARNVIQGWVVEILRGSTMAYVLLDIGGGTTITSMITNEAVDALHLAVGAVAYAVIKASDVMIVRN